MANKKKYPKVNNSIDAVAQDEAIRRLIENYASGNEMEIHEIDEEFIEQIGLPNLAWYIFRKNENGLIRGYLFSEEFEILRKIEARIEIAIY